MSPTMAHDVTALFQTYRECVRHIRNTYFSASVTQNWDTVDAFGEVNEVLFKQMVLYRLPDAYSVAVEMAVKENRIQIIPNSLFIPVMINREYSSGYWDYPVKELEPGFAKIAFKTYFDWDELDLIDYRYYKGVILKSDRHPDIIDREVLIDTLHAKLEYENA